MRNPNHVFPTATSTCGVANAAHFKHDLSTQLRGAMQRNQITQTELARRMRTSRAVIHRLLDEKDLSVTLTTISKAASALGQTFRVNATNDRNSRNRDGGHA